MAGIPADRKRSCRCVAVAEWSAKLRAHVEAGLVKFPISAPLKIIGYSLPSCR